MCNGLKKAEIMLLRSKIMFSQKIIPDDFDI